MMKKPPYITTREVETYNMYLNWFPPRMKKCSALCIMNLMNFLHRIFSISSACREHTQHTSNLDTIGPDVGVLIGEVYIFQGFQCIFVNHLML